MREPLVAQTGSLQSTAIMIKCHSCLADKKWLKSPHNRFKSAPFVKTNDESVNGSSSSCSSSRSQEAVKIVSPSSALFLHTTKPQVKKLKFYIEIVFILRAVIILSTAAHTITMAKYLEASTSPSASSLSLIRLTSASQQVQAGMDAPNSNATSLMLQSHQRATTRRSAPNFTTKADTEDEVDLLRPVVQQSSEQAHRASSQSHIYKIRAAPLNGKLSPPSPSTIRQIQISDALVAHRRVSQVKHRTGSEADKAATATPAATTATTLLSNSQDAANFASANFGNRAVGMPHRVAVTSSSLTAPINMRTQQRQQEQQQNQAHEHCKQPNEQARELDQGGGSSIAASSQTLRLTGSNRTMAQLIGFQPEALSATTTSARSAASSIGAARFREPAGEVEELPSRDFEARLKLEPPQMVRMKPSLIAARASTTSQTNQGQASASNQLRLANSIAETSMATEPFNSGGSEDVAGSESRPTSSSSGSSSSGNSSVGSSADSILTLIDDYDSKIITNKTKAQLSCDSGEMILRLNFSEPFKGIVYPDHNRLSPCRFFGDGHHNYELRLPLRGCGTRQAAPRVFVNDVIVRFHKTLELEEDEMKTLICRYPPPLASIPLESFGQSAISHSSSSSSGSGNSNSNSLARPTNGEEPSQALDGQFEFVDPHSGRPTRPEPGSSGQVETISENLVVAPSGGAQVGGQQNSANGAQLSPYQHSVGANGNRLNANLRNQQSPSGRLPTSPGGALIGQGEPVDLFNQRNSFIGAGNNVPGAGSTDTSSSMGQQGYFERLSSIELLFLISSLMFLVLLALGIAGSFYCFRHQTNRAGGQRASAILRRKRRRYLSPAMVTAAAPTRLQQYQSQRHQGGQLAPISASPSPGSDLSGRGLLANSSSSLGAGIGHYNRAYQPEPPSGNLQRYLAAANADGGHHYASQFAAAALVAGGDDRQRPMNVRGLVRAPGDSVLAHHKRQQPAPPVVGRRDTVLYGSTNDGAIGHEQHYLSPGVGHQLHQHGRHSRAKLRAKSSTFATSQLESADGQPLLLAQQPALNTDGAHFEHHYRGRPNLRAKLQHDTTGQLVSAQYALVNKPRNAHNLHGLHHSRFADHHPIYDNHQRVQQQQQQQLWRAKSLSSVRQAEDMRNFERKPIGGTLSRHEQAISSQHYQQRHHYPMPAQVSEKELRHAGYDAKHDLQFSNVSSLSYSESEPEAETELEANNNHVSGLLQTKSRHFMGDQLQQAKMKLKPKPRILLKSIEDSYITNITEISEQEYVKRDSMRPLSMAAWKALQPETADKYDDGDRYASERDREEEEQEEEQAVMEEQRYLSAQTNLRSLTELDVNFARLPESGKSSLRPAVSMDHVLKAAPSPIDPGQQQRQRLGGRYEHRLEQLDANTPPPERSSSVPDVAALKQGGESTTADNNNHSISSGLDQQQTPDLILSPDYDYDRLELKSNTSPSSPHNSVSYV